MGDAPIANQVKYLEFYEGGPSSLAHHNNNSVGIKDTLLLLRNKRCALTTEVVV
jgi:hypothetical protein